MLISSLLLLQVKVSNVIELGLIFSEDILDILMLCVGIGIGVGVANPNSRARHCLIGSNLL